MYLLFKTEGRIAAALLSLVLLSSCGRPPTPRIGASPATHEDQGKPAPVEDLSPIQAVLLTNAPCASVTFRRLGLGTGGALLCAAIDPSNPETLYCGTDQDKVFRSRDGGKTWHVLGAVGENNHGLPGYGQTMGLVVDPSNPRIVWCGSGVGLYKSVDGGDHWRNMTYRAMKDRGGPLDWFMGIAVDPNRSEIVYASQGLKGGPGKERMLIKTLDGGETWTILPGGLGLGRQDYAHLVIDPTSEFREGVGHLRVFRYGHDGASVSEDGGVSWAAFSETSLKDAVDSLVVIPRDGKPTLVASVRTRGKSPGMVRVMKSEDLGQTWRTTYRQETVYGLQEPHPLGWSPASPDVLYLGRHQFIDKSEDGGETWKNISDYQCATDRYGDDQDGHLLWDYRTDSPGNMGDMIYPLWRGTYQIAMCAADPKVALIPSHDSVLRTTNGGKSWEDVGIVYGSRIVPGEQGAGRFPQESTHLMRGRGIWAAAATCLDQDPFDPKTYAVGLMDQGLRISRDGGEWWEYAYRGMDSYQGQRNTFALGYDPDVKGRIYVGTRLSKGKRETQMMGFYLSEDGGRTFKRTGPRVETARIPGTEFMINDLVIDPRSPPAARTLYIASKELGLFKSVDGGKEWKPLTQGLDEKVGIAKLVMHPADSRCLYAISEAKNGLFRTMDGGESWQRIGQGLRSEYVIDIALSPSSPDHLWVINAESLHWASSGSIFVGSRRGDAWREIQAPFFAPHALGVHPRNPEVFYVSTVGQREKMEKICGLFRTMDGGRSWRILHSDLVPSRYAAFRMCPGDPQRFFFTDFSAAFEVRDPLKPTPLEGGGPK